jgi:hypothetical protein
MVANHVLTAGGRHCVAVPSGQGGSFHEQHDPHEPPGAGTPLQEEQLALLAFLPAITMAEVITLLHFSPACIGYLGHPFEQERQRKFSPFLFYPTFRRKVDSNAHFCYSVANSKEGGQKDQRERAGELRK